MAKKKQIMSNDLAIGFILGVFIAVLLISVSSYSRPYYGYGMMGMMYGGTNCNLTDSELEILGEDLMDRMVGDPALHEQMDQQMADDRIMHILMAKMMTGCR